LAGRHLGGIGLDLVPTPDYEPDMMRAALPSVIGGAAEDFTGIAPPWARTTVKLSQMNAKQWVESGHQSGTQCRRNHPRSCARLRTSCGSCWSS
jgi:hypothetical protein